MNPKFLSKLPDSQGKAVSMFLQSVFIRFGDTKSLKIPLLCSKSYKTDFANLMCEHNRLANHSAGHVERSMTTVSLKPSPFYLSGLSDFLVLGKHMAPE